MKIFVPIKRVPDYQARIKIKDDGSGIVTDGIKWIVNPFDEIAVEEALRLKEQGKATEVIVISIGPEDVSTQLRYAMAMGADAAVLIKTESPIDSDTAARLLAATYKRGVAGGGEQGKDFGLIILGKQAIDSDAGQTPQILGTILDIPVASFASKVELTDGSALVTREVDGGLETVELPTPCVISTDLRLNEPRYASLPGIQKAKKKPLDIINAEDLGVALTPKVAVIKLAPPAKKSAGKKVGSVGELIEALEKEAKVL